MSGRLPVRWTSPAEDGYLDLEQFLARTRMLHLSSCPQAMMAASGILPSFLYLSPPISRLHPGCNPPCCGTRQRLSSSMPALSRPSHPPLLNCLLWGFDSLLVSNHQRRLLEVDGCIAFGTAGISLGTTDLVANHAINLGSKEGCPVLEDRSITIPPLNGC